MLLPKVTELHVVDSQPIVREGMIVGRHDILETGQIAPNSSHCDQTFILKKGDALQVSFDILGEAARVISWDRMDRRKTWFVSRADARALWKAFTDHGYEWVKE